jgi:diguanylate cyclase (GGDEF)-like protein/PAS domain S-box-containing protein
MSTTPIERESATLRQILVIEDPKNRQAIPLDRATYSIGRDPSNDIVIRSRLVSRHHATLLRVKYPGTRKHSFWLIDGDLNGNRSTNGVFVNGKRCLSHELQHDDSIVFGGGGQASYHSVSAHNANQLVQPASQADMVRECPTLLGGSDEELDRLSEEALVRLASFPELLPHPIIEISLDGKITYLNPAALVKFDDIQELHAEHPILNGILSQFQDETINLFVREVECESRIFEQHVHYIAESRTIRSYIFDITERKQAEAAMRESEERYRAVVRQTSEGILLVDGQTQSILEANAAYCQLLGYSHEEIRTLNLNDILVFENINIRNKLYHKLRESQEFFGESLHCRQDGSLVNVEVSVSLIFYGGKEVLCFAVRDITERKQAQEVIHYQAFHDLLTGLPNRSLFNQTLSDALQSAKWQNNAIAVMFLDVDRFKTINDTLGHAVGDLLLKEFAERLTACLREGDIVARWGGDEFTILLPYIDMADDASKIANRILKAFQSAFHLEQHELYVSTSIGIALYPEDGTDAETLLQNADSALYRAKERGRNNYQFYVSTMNSQASKLLRLENRLHHAIDNDEFSVYYQPQFNAQTGEITGIEALIRWPHPQFGEISPSQFIPLAEETGLIVPIGEWVLRTACAQNRAWIEAGLPAIRVAVNLSARQFQQPSLVETIAQILKETRLDPYLLELEITETTLMQNIEFARDALRELQAMGVYISMDDFGTGYSSLGYLKQFPFQTLKIDQSFVRELKDDPRDTAIISAVLALGNGLNLRVVVEGVETQGQLRLLQRLHCQEMQGFLFSKPLNVSDTTKFLHKYNRRRKNILSRCKHSVQIESKAV